MSHPDPLYDPENSYEDDEMFTEPDESDVPFAEYLYDDYNDFYREDEIDSDWQEIRDAHDGTAEYRDDLDPDELDDAWNDDYDDSMDGDFDSAMRDAGWGTDEDYGYYGEDY
jgi:hypothetical protein